MNNSLFFVVCIVAIIYAASTFQTYLKTRSSKTEDDAAELEETLTKIAMLEDRIKVLERIVTENKYDLKSEISKL
jgi:hypothetical protein